MHYTQMGWSERLRIYFLLECGHSLPAIARRLGRHPTTIRRELKRNAHAACIRRVARNDWWLSVEASSAREASALRYGEK